VATGLSRNCCSPQRDSNEAAGAAADGRPGDSERRRLRRRRYDL